MICPALLSMHRQRGAVLMVMLVIMVLGVTFYLVGALSNVALQTARNEKSSSMLAQAKEAIIGFAVNGTGGGQRPGAILKPDSFASTESPPDYDGTAETGCLDATKPAGLPLTTNGTNMRCLGRLPWKDYALSIDSPSENDPSGFMPWYALSTNLGDLTIPFNSELLNTDNTLHLPNNYPAPPHPWLVVRDMKGNVLSDRVAFLIIIPGTVLPGQSRPPSPTLAGASQYLDSITVPAGCTAPCIPGTYSNADMDGDFIIGDEHRWMDDPSNPGKQIEDPSYQFNDKLLYVTIDELMPLIEKRIAREVKSCLDDYAAASAGKYPWAAPVSDPAFTGAYGQMFGRVSTSPNTSTSSGPGLPAAVTLNDALISLQNALDTYFNAGNALNAAALVSAGNYVRSLRTSISSPPAPANFSNTIDTAGDWAIEFTMGQHTYATVTQKITNALNAVAPLASPSTDSAMSATWPASCGLFASVYWPDWKNLVFYQVASGYAPGSTATCGGSCLTINGSGNTNGGNGTYRAVVIGAGKKLGGQTRADAYAAPPNDYLSNPTLEKSADPAFVSNASPGNTFITYKTTDPYYQNVNDLVLCLDGKNNCK